MTDLFTTNKSDSYGAADIEVLEGLEPVRRRPGMYIGGTDERALHHLVGEILDNSMDEAVAGYASRIEMRLNGDGSVTIADNGRGIPVDNHPKYPKKSALEVILDHAAFRWKIRWKSLSDIRRPAWRGQLGGQRACPTGCGSKWRATKNCTSSLMHAGTPRHETGKALALSIIRRGTTVCFPPRSGHFRRQGPISSRHGFTKWRVRRRICSGASKFTGHAIRPCWRREEQNACRKEILKVPEWLARLS